MATKKNTPEGDSQETQPLEEQVQEEPRLSPMEYVVTEEGHHKLLDKHVQDGEVMGVPPVFHPSRLDVMKARALAYGYDLREVENA